MHRNTASRKVSRLTKKVKALSVVKKAPAKKTEAVKPAVKKAPAKKAAVKKPAAKKAKK